MQFTGRNLAAITALCGALGAVAAAAVVFHMRDNYVSTAVLRLGPGLGPDRRAGLARLQQQVLSRTSLAQIIQTVGLYPEERRSIPLEDIVEQMRSRHIQILAARKPGNTGSVPDAIQIRFSDPDRAKAQAATRELTRLFLGDGPPSIVLANAPPVVSLEVLDPASLPQQPFEPNRPAWIVAGLMAGVAVGLVVAGARRWPAVVSAGIGGAMLAGALSFAIPDTWVSTAVVAVKPAEAALAVPAEAPQAGAGVRISRLPQTPGLLQLQSKGRDRFETQAVVRQSAARLIPLSGNRIVEVAILDPASLPQQPASPRRDLIALAGLAAGLLLGGIWQRRRPRTRLAGGGSAAPTPSGI